MFLVDSNCWMQLIRSHPNAPEVRSFLQAIPFTRLFVTDFAISSIALNMDRRGQLDEFVPFLEHSTIGSEVEIIRLYVDELAKVAAAASAHGLDYDDAYQYAAAEINGLRIVSFDADFDRTPNGRLTPAAALQLFKDEPT